MVLAASPASPQLYINETALFRSVYSAPLQCPVQVSWTLHRHDVGQNLREPSWRFTHDLPDFIMSAQHSDYSHSGYDRGHMCPAADFSADKAMMRQTFVMSNICPQVPSVNRGTWKTTENYCRNAALVFDSVSVLAVPIFIDRDTTYIGQHRLAVPHAFFKAVWVAGTDSVLNSWFIFNK